MSNLAPVNKLSEPCGPGGTTRGARKQKGVALVLALWILTLLTVLAAAYGYAMHVERRLIIHGVEVARARAIAEAGLWLAVADLLRPQPARQWRADGTPARFEFGRGEITLRIQGASGKIDLNTAHPELLSGLLQAGSPQGAGVDVTFLLHAILDWRDPDKVPRKPGFEDRYYEGAGYGAKDGPFNSIEELRLVAGMDNAVFSNVYPALTIHSLRSGINPMVAPREVLLALPGSHAGRVDAFLATRHTAKQFSGLAGVDARYFTFADDTNFTITSVGTVGESSLRLDLVVSMSPGANPPYSVLSWREAKPTRLAHGQSETGKQLTAKALHETDQTTLP